ncbi:Retinol dehydrogenase 14 [Symbiodinium microadriaticum]|uniref:Retinol dehydrogenase 14 n=1 Tax=Symbiodinium microadriaticum TaxID=2951 RepID=A0A1Q9DPH6_SYMMI|nr:Retinol dehydrogenase 14 [Symbiodinium microadriaticum]
MCAGEGPINKPQIWQYPALSSLCPVSCCQHGYNGFLKRWLCKREDGTSGSICASAWLIGWDAPANANRSSTAGISCRDDMAGKSWKSRFGLVDAAPAADFDKLGQDYEAAREAVSPSRVAAIPGSFCQAKPLQLTCRTVEADYHPFKAYARSKLANVLFTRALARRLSDKHIFANSCHPGGIMTNLPKHVQKSTEDNMGKGWRYYMDELMQLVMLTPPRGAVTQLYLASSPEIEEKGIRGQYFRNQAIHANPPKFSTEELEEKLWNISEKLVAEYL